MTTKIKHLLALLATSAASYSFAQTTFYADNNGGTAGFGNVSGVSWGTASNLWNSNILGTGTVGPWVNSIANPNNAVFDMGSTTSSGPSINLVDTATLQVGNITVQNYGTSITSAVGISTSAAISGTNIRAINFGSSSVVNIANNANSVADVSIRAFAGVTGGLTPTDNTVNVTGGFTKTGAGTLAFVGQTSSSPATLQSATLNVSGTYQVNEGAIVLRADGTGPNTSRTVNVSNATFNVASGALLTVSNALSYTTVSSPTNFNVNVGGIGGFGTVRGDGIISGATLTWRPGTVTPGTDGTIGTLTVADQASGIGNSWNTSSAVANTAFSFGGITTGGLRFDLAAPGTNDVLALSDISSVDLGGIQWNSFTFTTLGGFGEGVYTLATGLNTTTGSLGSTLTGDFIPGALYGVLSLSGSTLRLEVIPEPSAAAALAGVGALALVGLRRRRS